MNSLHIFLKRRGFVEALAVLDGFPNKEALLKPFFDRLKESES